MTNCINILGADLYDIIQLVFKIFQYSALVLILFKTTEDIVKALTSDDVNANKNVYHRFFLRIIYGVLVFFTPLLTNLIIDSGIVGTNIQKCWGTELDNLSNEIKTLRSECEQKEEDNTDKTVEYYWNNKTYTCDMLNVKDVTNLVFYKQANYGDVGFCTTSTVKSSGCGAVSLSMIASAYLDTTYNPKYVANYLCSHYDNSLINGGVSETVLVAAARSWGLNATLLYVNDFTYYNSTYDAVKGAQILQAVNEGDSIILGIPVHYIAVGPNESCGEGQVYLYDGSFTSRCGCVTPKELWQKTYNSSGRCTAGYSCGWSSAIRISSN